MLLQIFTARAGSTVQRNVIGADVTWLFHYLRIVDFMMGIYGQAICFKIFILRKGDSLQALLITAVVRLGVLRYLSQNEIGYK